MESSTENILTYRVGRWLRLYSLGETCGILKLIPEKTSRKRSSLAMDEVDIEGSC